jgi:hypothetical protein
VKILEVIKNPDGSRDPIILSFTPWYKTAGWDDVAQQIADKTKEDPMVVAVKVNDWRKTNVGATPNQAFKAITGDKSAVLQDTEMPGVDLNKQPPENNGQWIDQGRWWVSKEPILSNGKREFAIKIDLDNPTTWPRPSKDNKCPAGWVLDKNGKMCVPTGASTNKEEPPKPVNGKCETGFKLSPDGKTCIPDGSTVIPAPVPAGETEEQKKAREKKEADKKKDDTVVAKLIWPAGNATLVNRNRPVTEKHQGIDIAVPVGTPVVAPEAGKIIAQAVQANGAGLYIKMSSTDGKRVHIFMHLSKYIVTKGDTVAQGDDLGESGGKKGDPLAGNSTGPHLHWGVSEGGKWIDPETLIK